MDKDKVINKFLGNKDILAILQIIENLDLKEACLCAGTIRNNFWNIMDGKEVRLETDVDVIFYDKNISYEKTVEIEKKLKLNYPKYDWELKNEVHMHFHSNMEPFKNVEDAISKFPEICTAIGLRYKKGEYEWIAPYGMDDIFNKIVRPTPIFQNNEINMKIYKDRINNKKWFKKWENLKILYK